MFKSNCKFRSSLREGDEMYQKHTQAKNEEQMKKHLESSLQYYHMAFEAAIYPTDKGSAAKNCGEATWRLANVLLILDKHLDEVEISYREAIKHFSRATVAGSKCEQKPQWSMDLAHSYSGCVLAAMALVDCYPHQARVGALQAYVDVMYEDSQKGACFLEMANVLNRAGCIAIDNKDSVKAMQAFHDCYRPLQECFRVTRRHGEIFNEASVLEQDVFFHLATAEAMHAIKLGDNTLKAALEDDEQLNMSLVYDAMDLYKKAVLAAREIEVEMEAVADSRLGSLFDKVLHIKSKARDYFKLCMHLADSLHPKTFNAEPWYKTCVETLQRFHSEEINNDEYKRQAERNAYLKELEEELKDIRGADVGSNAVGLLRHLYSKYPPKKAEHKLNEEGLKDPDDTKKYKKVVLTAIQHYHPDKQNKEEFGMKWAVLCEEITKILNRRYTRCKDIT